MKLSSDCTLPISGKNFSMTGNYTNKFDLLGSDLATTNCSVVENELVADEGESAISSQVNLGQFLKLAICHKCKGKSEVNFINILRALLCMNVLCAALL